MAASGFALGRDVPPIELMSGWQQAGARFVADLTAGQTITLNTTESDSNIDLFLYMDQDFVDPVDSSTNAAGDIERIQVDSPGTYFIEVQVVNGASTYTLNIAADAAGSAAVVSDDIASAVAASRAAIRAHLGSRIS